MFHEGHEVGRAVKINVDKNVRDMDTTLFLQSRARRGLNRGTTFWPFGAKPSLATLSSVNAALGGLDIGVAPAGPPGATRAFADLLGDPADRTLFQPNTDQDTADMDRPL